jgi:hypothetical protein
LRRAYAVATVFVVAFVLFAFFVPFIQEHLYLGRCTTPTGCERTPLTVSLTYRLFNIGEVNFGSSYQFWTSPPSVHLL